MKTHTQMYRARTIKSAKNAMRHYGRVPVKVKLVKKAGKYHGMNMYKITCHLKKRRR